MERNGITEYRQGKDDRIAYNPVNVKVVEINFKNVLCGSQSVNLDSMEEEKMSW